MTAPISAPAAVRNCAAIAGVLQYEMMECTDVLEIGSGCGHHAVTFAAAMPSLNWHTSDLEENHESINAQITAAGLENVRSPRLLDVRTASAGKRCYDAVYSCNTAHIMSMAAVQRMLALIGEVLDGGGVFCYYGPMTRSGRFNTPSNAAFDASLRARDPLMGIRDLDDFDAELAAAGLRRLRIYAMPANNLLIVWSTAREGG